MESFSTREVARLLGLSETQVRSQARAGFLTPERGPRNGYRFSFQDLVLLRTARELAHARVPPRRIRTALCGLARQLPSGRSLTEMRILAEGGGVVVHDGGNAWNPESGQLHIDFVRADVVSPGAGPAKALLSATRAARKDDDPWELFDLALELEGTDPVAALEAYSRALVVDPTLTDAHVNIGRLLQLAGRTQDAIQHYVACIRSGTTDPTAAFNLGTALEELGQWQDALAAYQRAVETDSRFADAHFNLARLHDQLGRRAEAIRHLRAYKRLVD
jgi:tetratricopeptide (TPR) repeat protein